MPFLRKIALISGLAIIIQFSYCQQPKKRLRQYLSEAASELPSNTQLKAFFGSRRWQQHVYITA
jgi:hypothetical protein